MDKTYVVAMIESLKSKIEILKEIRQKDAEQLEIIKAEQFIPEQFDKTVDEKDVLIYKLNKLDNGFQIVFDNLRDQIENNKAELADEIREMQRLISEITELSTTVQAEEARNKAALEAYFNGEHNKIKAGRSAVKAIKSYNQTMIQGRTGFWDDKK